ncbi:MAG: pentapeptide repeat-containing protein [Proteobacteria bacterium]|nr:MAG: pentapeptide repeat-containing protein [Pseudomonadota bacterium]
MKFLRNRSWTEIFVLDVETLEDLDLSDTVVHRLVLRNENASRTSFRGAHLGAAHFQDCRLDDTDFTEAMLTNSQFYQCSLKNAVFERTHGSTFFECDLTGATFTGSDLEGNDFTGSTLSDATFEGTRGLWHPFTILWRVRFNSRTRWGKYDIPFLTGIALLSKNALFQILFVVKTAKISVKDLKQSRANNVTSRKN